jgi:hypothetical protein
VGRRENKRAYLEICVGKITGIDGWEKQAFFDIRIPS